MNVYALHGVTVESPLTLPALIASPGLEPELRLQELWGSVVDWGGEVFAQLDQPGARYVARRGDVGVSCEYPGFGGVLFGSDGRVSLAASVREPETARALLSGSAFALWLVARSQLVLHASTVAWDDCCVALVGGSAAGKTTLAAECVIAGARLVGDDVLRVTLEGERALWHAGARWLRLRAGSAALVDAWRGPFRHVAADARWVVEPAESSLPTSSRLDALVWPRLAGDARVVGVQRLTAAEALRRLVLAPRVRGLIATELLRAQFHEAARLVRTVPCFEATIPPGPPFANAAALRLQLLRAASVR